MGLRQTEPHTNLLVVTELFDEMEVDPNKKTKLYFKLVFILRSSEYDVTGHEGLTATFYGHLFKQRNPTFDSIFYLLLHGITSTVIRV